MILAGDVGGTNTRLALLEPGGSPRAPVLVGTVASRDGSSLEDLVARFLGGSADRTVTRAVFGIAGPVVDNRTEATNLPWLIDGNAMGRALGSAHVTLINDLEATGWGVPLLEPDEIEVLQPGRSVIGNRALIAAGTGLGEALLVWDGARLRPSASEGGHVDFAPRDALEDELLQWLRDAHGRVSYERVLSGRGLADLYRFLTDTGRGDEPTAVAERFARAEHPAAVVTESGLDGTCERARLALERFAMIYGAEAGNLALKALAVGGVYVGGGIAPKILPALSDGRFVAAFRDKGRLTPLLESIPVAVVLDDRAALWGASAVALGYSPTLARNVTA